MNASESMSNSGRTTAVAHFIGPDWGRIADRLAPVIDRQGEADSGDSGRAPTALVFVPDAGAALALARALRAARPAIARILPVTDAPRAERLLKAFGAPIVIATPADVERLLRASVLPLDRVQAVALVAANELDVDEISRVMASVPKEARRVLIAPEATPTVDLLLERYFHRAHRLADDDAAHTTPAAVQYVCVRGAGADAIPALLDELDPPSAIIVTADASAAQAALADAGYPSDAPLARVTDGAAPANVALVVFAGLPTAQAFETAMSAQPGRAVALISARQLGALRRLAGSAGVTPYVTRRATSAARAHEARVRSELSAVLTDAYPSREILALEPLLGAYDGIELAGAALRLLDAARQTAPSAAAAPTPTAPSAPARPARPPRTERAPRTRDEFPLREPGASAPRFVDRTIRRDRDDRPPRRDRDDRPPRRGAGEKPRGGFGDKGARGFGDRDRRGFGDKPRGGFGDKPRGGFKGKPRDGGARRPRGER